MKNGSTADKDTIQTTSMKTGAALNVGCMYFPFEFQLPMQSPACPSIPSLGNDAFANFAHVSYFIKATVNEGKVLKRGNIVCLQPLWVERRTQLELTPLHLKGFRVDKILNTIAGNIFQVQRIKLSQ